MSAFIRAPCHRLVAGNDRVVTVIDTLGRSFPASYQTGSETSSRQFRRHCANLAREEPGDDEGARKNPEAAGISRLDLGPPMALHLLYNRPCSGELVRDRPS